MCVRRPLRPTTIVNTTVADTTVAIVIVIVIDILIVPTPVSGAIVDNTDAVIFRTICSDL